MVSRGIAVPDTRKHRGPHPEDAALFHPDRHPALTEAVRDLSWLMSRNYALPSALKLVGDRRQLTDRQRTAVLRCACSDAALARRTERRTSLETRRGKPLHLDGYNVLTTVEAALGRGVLLRGRDGCYRDMASLHGSYRKVEETLPALHAIGDVLDAAGVTPCRWYLDRPVSNSGRLKGIMNETARGRSWPWEVELVHDPDPILADAEDIVATADSGILDRCRGWVNLARTVIDARVPATCIVNLSGTP